MASTQRTKNKRKRTVDRSYGESLTTTDILLRLTEKDWNKKRRATKRIQNQSVNQRLVSLLYPNIISLHINFRVRIFYACNSKTCNILANRK